MDDTGKQQQQAAADDLANLTAEPTESMAQIAEDFEAGQEDFQAMYDAGGVFKKGVDDIALGFEAIARQNAAARSRGGVEMEPHLAEASQGKAPEDVIEIPSEPELEKSTEGYIEKTEKAGETKQVIVDDYTQAILLKPLKNQNARFLLHPKREHPENPYSKLQLHVKNQQETKIHF